MFFDKTIETMPLDKLRELQLERLKYIVDYCYRNVPFYTKKFDAIGLKPSHIARLSDIKLIPFMTKDDFRDNYPYGLLAVPTNDIVRIHASSGTTGKPVVVGYTASDINIWTEIVARFIVASGGSCSDIVQIAFGYGLFTGALGLHQGWERIGATVIPASSGNTERQLMLMRDLKATVLVSTPSYAMYIAETMQRLKIPVKDLSLRLGFFGAEASTEQTHKQLMKAFNIATNDNYGLTEVMGPGVAGECHIKNGMHIAEDHFLAEIVDQHTLEPLEPGNTGELIFTTLTKQGMPVLRYRTKDLTSINRDICKCGRTFARINKIIGRTDDMLIIRGVNVFPSQIEAVLMDLSEVSHSYEIIVDRVNFSDTIEVRVEVNDGKLLVNFKKLEELRTIVKEKLKTVLQIDIVVKLVEPNTITRYEGKVVRVKDLRKKI